MATLPVLRAAADFLGIWSTASEVLPSAEGDSTLESLPNLDILGSFAYQKTTPCVPSPEPTSPVTTLAGRVKTPSMHRRPFLSSHLLANG